MSNECINTSLNEALRQAGLDLANGKVASYIPELARADGSLLGLCLLDCEGRIYRAGDCDTSFTVQSVGKVFLLLAALERFGEQAVFERVGMEPSGAPFSELSTLGEFSEKPSNPFINAGAIVLASLASTVMTFEEFLDFVRGLCGNQTLQVNEAVYLSESAHSERNHSLAWELKRLKLLENDVQTSLDFYTRLCAIEASAADLARFGLLLARQGEQLVSPLHVTTVLSLMFTCGLYNGSGAFATRSGVAAKSGVGGGIVAVVPGQFGIGTFGPALDRNGNSIGGLRLLEILSAEFGWHIFGPRSEQTRQQGPSA